MQLILVMIISQLPREMKFSEANPFVLYYNLKYWKTQIPSTNSFFDFLPKGIYVFEYDLRVNNSGNMSNGITTIQSMYAPEFSSHSEGVRIKITTEK